jgi:hypothetical protein
MNRCIISTSLKCVYSTTGPWCFETYILHCRRNFLPFWIWAEIRIKIGLFPWSADIIHLSQPLDATCLGQSLLTLPFFFICSFVLFTMVSLTGKPPFATDEPDSFYESATRPQGRLRQPPPPDPNQRTSAYNLYVSSVDTIFVIDFVL